MQQSEGIKYVTGVDQKLVAELISGLYLIIRSLYWVMTRWYPSWEFFHCFFLYPKLIIDVKGGARVRQGLLHTTVIILNILIVDRNFLLP